MSMTPDAVVRSWFEEVWNQRRPEAIDRLMAADAKAHGLSPEDAPLEGPGAFKALHQQFCGAFPDLRITVEQTVTEGDRVAAYCRVTGTQNGVFADQPATGRRVDFRGFALVRIAGGQIVEGWNCFDFQTMNQQLAGAAPPVSPQTRSAGA